VKAAPAANRNGNILVSRLHRAFGSLRHSALECRSVHAPAPTHFDNYSNATRDHKSTNDVCIGTTADTIRNWHRCGVVCPAVLGSDWDVSYTFFDSLTIRLADEEGRRNCNHVADEQI